MAINTYPEARFRIPAYLKHISSNPEAEGRFNLFIADAINIDFRVNGILENDGSSFVAEQGNKYIIGNAGSIPAAIASSVDVTLTTGDIVVYNDRLDENGNPDPRWELFFDSDNPSFGASGGALCYVIDDAKFYGWDGLNWAGIASGDTGDKGDTGPAVPLGSEYSWVTNETFNSTTDATGRIHLNNILSSGYRPFRIDANPTDSNLDLFDIFFPFGTGSADRNPIVSVFAYNKTINKLWGARFKATAAAIESSDTTELNFDSSDTVSDYSVIISESGTGNWSGAANVWEANHEIYVLAISDGVAGLDGSVGATGQGITYAGTIDNELYIQYLDSDGNPIPGTIATGIVSGEQGVTGDPGEVGLYMYFTGGDGTDWQGNNTVYPNETNLLNKLQNGDVIWANDVYLETLGVTQAAIAVDLITKDSIATSTYTSFNLTTAEVNSEWYNRPGTLYFYTFHDYPYDIRLRSMVSYEKVKGNSPQSGLLLTGITYSLLDADLNISDRDYGFILPVPDGVRGTGITFGEIIDNTLYLDYIDADGNTFGRFASVQGVSGAEGQMNPFNIRYGTTGDGSSFNTGYINVGTRELDGRPRTLYVSGTAENGSTVLDYLRQSDDIGIKTGYLTVFSRTDSSNFGIFRFKSMTTSNDGVIFNIAPSDTSGLVAGNLTQIIGTAPNGLTTGDNTALFALSLDGKRGFTGTITGYTFGIEYFIGADSPRSRTNGDPLEIGDKWYCTTVGLEFTFLGASGDEDSVVGYGLSLGGVGDPIAWVQTNNARQGRRGPQGIPGIGSAGEPGATGFNYRGTWNPAVNYNERDVVFSTYEILKTIGAGGAPASGTTNWTNYFNSVGMPGTTSGAFIALSNIQDGNAPGVSELNATSWGVLIGGFAGPEGAHGNTGTRGTGVIGAAFDQGEDKLTFTIQNYSGETPTDQDEIDVFGVRGPTGPAGPIGGSNNQYLYRNSLGEVASSTYLKIVNGLPTLVRYNETLSETGAAYTPFDNTLSFTHSGGSSLKLVTDNVFSTSATIERMDFIYYPSDGGAQTIIIEGPDDPAKIINVGNASNDATRPIYTMDGEVAGSVYYSIQGEIGSTSATVMRWPRYGEAAIMTARRSGDDMYITYVLYEKVK